MTLDYDPSRCYILDADHNVIQVSNEEMMAWKTSFDVRIVGRDTIERWDGQTVAVHTDFCLWKTYDQNTERYVHFETMIFGDTVLDQHFWQWQTWDEAVVGHQMICLLMWAMH